MKQGIVLFLHGRADVDMLDRLSRTSLESTFFLQLKMTLMLEKKFY